MYLKCSPKSSENYHEREPRTKHRAQEYYIQYLIEKGDDISKSAAE